MLEVGIGNGLVSYYLRAMGIDLTTVDIDPRLQPDVVASVTDLPFRDSAFEVVTCFEVLEHIPWELVPRAVAELHRVTCSHALISIPDLRRKYRIFFQFHRGSKAFRKVLVIPLTRNMELGEDGEHHWEIGLTGYPLSKIKSELKRGPFIIEHDFVPFNNPYHRFFRLKKK